MRKHNYKYNIEQSDTLDNFLKKSQSNSSIVRPDLATLTKRPFCPEAKYNMYPRDGVDELEKFINHQFVTHKNKIQEKNRKIYQKKQVQQQRQKQNRKNEMLQKQKYDKYMQLLERKVNLLQENIQFEQRTILREEEYENKVVNKLQEIMMRMQFNYQSAINSLCMNRNYGFQQAAQEKKTPSIKQQSRVSVKKEIQRVPNQKILRKFRIIGYVVYFSILFPKFATTFSRKRRQYFQKEVVQILQLEDSIDHFYDQFQIQGLNDFKKTLKSQQNFKTKSALPKEKYYDFQQLDERGKAHTFSFKLSSIGEITHFTLSQLISKIKSGNFNSFIEILSFFFIDKSFIKDEVFLIQQLFCLKLNKTHFYLELTKEQQAQFLINFFLSKLIAYGYLILQEAEQDETLSEVSVKNEKTTKLLMFQQKSAILNKQMLMNGLNILTLINQTNKDEQLDLQYFEEGNLQKIPFEECPLPMQQLSLELEQQQEDQDQDQDEQKSKKKSRSSKRSSRSSKSSKASKNSKSKRSLGSERSVGQIISKTSRSQVNDQEYDLLNREVVIKNVDYQQILDKNYQHFTLQQENLEIVKQIKAILHKKCKVAREKHFRLMFDLTLDEQYIITKPQQKQLYTKQRQEQFNKQIKGYRAAFASERQFIRKNLDTENGTASSIKSKKVTSKIPLIKKSDSQVYSQSSRSSKASKSMTSIIQKNKKSKLKTKKKHDVIKEQQQDESQSDD